MEDYSKLKKYNKKYARMSGVPEELSEDLAHNEVVKSLEGFKQNPMSNKTRASRFSWDNDFRHAPYHYRRTERNVVPLMDNIHGIIRDDIENRVEVRLLMEKVWNKIKTLQRKDDKNSKRLFRCFFLWANGWSFEDIGEEMGFSKQYIAMSLKTVITWVRGLREFRYIKGR